jgi:hypothetical protein
MKWWRSLDVHIMWMCSVYLFIDAVNGFLLQKGLPGGGMSAAFKSLLLCLMLWQLLIYQRRTVVFALSLFLLLLLGPAYSLLLFGHKAGFSYDVGMALKLVSPLIACGYFADLVRRDRTFAMTSLHWCMAIGACVIVVNMALGRLGFGFTAYLPNDFFDELNLGTKGFFKATNEVSALLLVYSAYWFGFCWVWRRFWYPVAVVLALFCSSAMLTKTGNAGVVLLAVLVPLLHAAMIWRGHPKLLASAGVAVVLACSAVVFAWPHIVAHFPDKLWLAYQQNGLLGLLLSSRDLFVADNWGYASRHFAEWHRLLGIGTAGLDLYSSKSLAEIDPADLLIWFGFVGFAWCLLWFGLIVRASAMAFWQSPRSMLAAILPLNLVLLLVSLMAGHVMTSGMLWIPWGLLNGSLWLWQERPHVAQ